MNQRMARSILVGLGMLAIAACGKSSTAPTVSFVSPVSVTPANGATIPYATQPITLTFRNAVRAGSSSVSYAVEVATDANFASKVFSKDGIAEGSGGTTSVALNTLNGSTTYYWRTQTTIAGSSPAASPAQSFFVGSPVVLGTPGNPTPADNGTASDARPTFSVQNASRSGPAGTTYYEFQVSSNSSFSSILVQSGQIAEQSGGRTSWTSTQDLATGTYFWRVRAVDPANVAAGSYTSALTFQLVPFDMRKAIIWNNWPDLGSYAETANITLVDFPSNRIVVDFDKRDGPGRWPDVGFGDGDLEYTLGICLFINQQWNCSAVVQFWYGRDLAEGGPFDNMAGEWFYDNRWGAMKGYQPRIGEIVGWFVAAGNQRDQGNVIARERSKVLFLPYGQSYRR